MGEIAERAPGASGTRAPISSAAPDESFSSPASLSPAQVELIDYFASLAELFSLPRSAGQIYGLLFSQPNPVPFDEIVATLGISKGSASGNLKLLKGLKAVTPRHSLGDRRTFFEAETSIRQLIQSFLEDGVKNHLRDSESRLAEIAAMVSEERKLAPFSEETGSDHLSARISSLQTWHRKARRLIPWIARLTLPPRKKASSDSSDPKV